jgi:hypothetical protein
VTETIGNTLVVHAPSGMSAEARALASALPADPDHELVVADPPPESTGAFWESFAASLPKGRRALRLVLASRSRELGALAGHWLSTRLNRTVVAPDGVQIRDLNGSLFVNGSGWMRFRPGREPERHGRRFPRPAWESSVVSEPFGVGVASTAEPVPSGLWLRADGDKGRLDAGRNRLTHGVPCQPDILTISLGGRDLPELPLADIVTLWEALPAADRPRVRFVLLGPVSAHGKAFGPALADLIDAEVTCYTGIPVGRVDAPDVHLLRPDGSHGWNVFVQQVSFAPGGGAPRIRAHRAPLTGLTEIEPGVYRYADDVVIEIVLAGLWIRPPEAPAHAAAVRTTPVDPATNLLLCEGSEGRMWTVAREVLDRFDYSMRLVSNPVPTSAMSSAVPAPDQDDVLLPWLTDLLDTKALPCPTKPADEPPPSLKVSLPPIDVTAREDLSAIREWIRESWPDEFGDRADQLRAVLASNPKIVTGTPEDALADAVALRLFLTGRVPDLDGALRSGADGPHVRFTRCAVAALTALPSHRGATVSRLTPTMAQREFYRQHPVLSEWGFHTMLAAPSPGVDGTVDVLAWSMTGRKTALLEDPSSIVDGRVVFPPGTCFKVLEMTEDRILLRELSPTEIGADGAVDENRGSLDQLATTSLLRFLDKPATRKPERVPATLASGLFRLPGAGDE